MLHAGEVLEGRYQIVKIVGKGGMSTVYQARDLTNQKLLAIKDVERTGRDDNQLVEQSLAGEGRMLKQLSNPHLPKIYEIIENADNFMLVMDFIEGESLDKVIAREGAQSVDRVLYWGMQICEVFHYLHNQPTPIIYRDMKPANVILKPDGTLTMIDFGTARTQKIGVAMQADTICIGTEGFAAPEQFGGIGQSDARTDIFCLGATLYNMVTGRSPTAGGILPFERIAPALVDTPLAIIINKCIKNDPDERYQTAMELYEDLRLASTGAFQNPSKQKAGPLSGGFRKAEWQKQNLTGSGMISGALAGKMQRGKTENTSFWSASVVPAEGPKKEEQQQQSSWQEPGQRTDAPVQDPAHQKQGEDDSIWHKLMIIGVLVAIIFLVLSVVLVVLDQITAAIVFMMIALGAAALALIGLLRFRAEQENE